MYRNAEAAKIQTVSPRLYKMKFALKELMLLGELRVLLGSGVSQGY